MTALEHLQALVVTARLAFKRSPAAPAPLERILILGYAAIGDLLFFLPVIEALKQRYPKARFIFLANQSPVTQELMPATGLIDEIWLHDWEGTAAAAGRAGINQKIAEGGFDAAILTLSSPAHYFQEGLSAVPLRAGHLRPLEPAGLANTRLRLRRALVTGEPARRVLLNRVAWIGGSSENAVLRNLRLLGPLGLDAPSPSRAPKPRLPLSPQLKAWASEAICGLGPKKKVAVHLGPTRNQYHKIWDHGRFGRLCARLAQQFPLELVLVGSADEQAAVQCAGLAAAHCWVGRCSLLETFALIGACDLFIGNDTGLAKAAMALGVPTATIWGPTDPWELSVPWDTGRHLDIRTGIACSPCVRLGMAKEGSLNFSNCGHHDCLGKLEADFAFQAVAGKYGLLLNN